MKTLLVVGLASLALATFLASGHQVREFLCALTAGVAAHSLWSAIAGRSPGDRPGPPAAPSETCTERRP
jgi:hypothetical protein